MDYVTTHSNGDYATIGRGILEQNNRVPMGEDSAYLIHAVYKDKKLAKGPEIQEIKDAIRENGLWVFAVKRWTPKGVYVIQDPNAEGYNKTTVLSSLENAIYHGKEIAPGVIFSKDGKIRFAEKGENYLIGEQDSDKLGKNRIVIATVGLRGAEELAEVAYGFDKKARVFGCDVKKEAEQIRTLSSLDTKWSPGYQLNIDNDNDYPWNSRCAGGVALGIQKKVIKLKGLYKFQ